MKAVFAYIVFEIPLTAIHLPAALAFVQVFAHNSTSHLVACVREEMRKPTDTVSFAFS